MRTEKENLGKVSISIDKLYWNQNKDYDKLTIVEVENLYQTYISRKPVPAGTQITDKNYWIPFSSLKEEITLAYNQWVNRYGGMISSLVTVLNDVQNQVNDLYKAIAKGITFTGNKEVIEVDTTSNVTLSFAAINGLPVSCKLYKNNVLIQTWDSVTEWAETYEVNGDTEFRVDATQDEYTYNASWNVGSQYPFYGGAGDTYNDVVNSDDKLGAKYDISGIYDVTIDTDNKSIFFVIPNNTTILTITLNGFNVPMKDVYEEYIDGVEYKVYETYNKYVAGDYQLVINGYSTSEAELIAEIGANVNRLNEDTNSLLENVGNLNTEVEDLSRRVDDVEEEASTAGRRNKRYEPGYPNFSGLGEKYLDKNMAYPGRKFNGFVSNVELQGSALVGVPNAVYFDRVRKIFVAATIGGTEESPIYYYFDEWGDVDAFNPVKDVEYTNPASDYTSPNTTTYFWLNDTGHKYLYDAEELDLVESENIVNEINVLTQEMLRDANTIYHIEYDFDLNGRSITVPANSVLQFDGGSLRNGGIIGDNTKIIAEVVKIFETDMLIDGRWTADEYHPEWYGAIPNDPTFDCTNAINLATTAAGNSFGGTVKFVQGVYHFSGPINVNHKTSLVGAGMGTTILMQMENSDNHGIIIENSYAGIRLANFTIKGRRTNEVGDGIYIPNKTNATGQEDGEQKQYIYTEYNDANYQYHPGYKWILIDNIAVYGFFDGLLVGQRNFGVFVTNSYFSENIRFGVNFGTSDSTMENCYINNNDRTGLYINNGPNKFSNLKVVFNGIKVGYVADSAGIQVDNCASNTFVNCETQDNFCKGWTISAGGNLFVNCISSRDGRITQAGEYQPGYRIYGFNLSGTNYKNTNVFKNCAVFTGINSTVYDRPVNLGSKDSLIFDGIKIIPIHKKEVCVNPTYYIDMSVPTHHILSPTIIPYNDVNYFSPGITIPIDCITPGEINIYCMFRILTSANTDQTFFKYGNLELYAKYSTTKGKYTIRVRQSYNGTPQDSFTFIDPSLPSNVDRDIYIDSDVDEKFAVIMTLSGSRVTLRGIFKVNSNGYFKYFETSYVFNFTDRINNSKLIITSTNAINKIIVTQENIDTSYLIPGTLMTKFRDSALVYLCADSPIFNVSNGLSTSGTFANKPSAADNSVPVGFRYFCTDKQTTEGGTNGIAIFFKERDNGNDIWVDALGRTIS